MGKKEQQKKYDIIFIGGSLPAIVGAILAKKRNPQNSVLLIEGADQLGGNLVGHDVLGHHFDSGTHILQEIGDPEIDDIIKSSVKKENLVSLPSYLGDVVGTVKKQRIWSQTAFPDVYTQDPRLARQILEQIKQQTKFGDETNLRIAKARQNSVQSVSIERFGELATEQVILPIVTRLFGPELDLSGFALELCNLTRLNLVSPDEWHTQVALNGMQSRIAFPNQRKLPDSLIHNRKSLYSSGQGAVDFVAGLATVCKTLGIETLLASKVTSIDAVERTVSVENGNVKDVFTYDLLISCIPVSLTNMLVSKKPLPRPVHLPFRIIHFLLREPIENEECYYYFHDQESLIYRVTNYAAFSEREGDCRLSVEVIGSENVNDSALILIVERELINAGFFSDDSVEKSVCIQGSNGYPVPTVDNFLKFSQDFSQLIKFQQHGLFSCGLGSGHGIFFQNEILRSLVETIRTIS